VHGRQCHRPAVERDVQALRPAHEEVEAAAGELVDLPRSHCPLQVDFAQRPVAAHLDVRATADATQHELTGRRRLLLLVLLGIGAIEADYTFFTRGEFFGSQSAAPTHGPGATGPVQHR